ncbi:MAG: saccharopine dehydrogenase NADP-binding domain-containing protein [Chloroflexi bacterium]|nr:saccharopine dehydrogenase NADP-binding domain-containing protein [Chloroflexota bacterium]
MTTSILILGGYGYAGRLLARHLLAESDAGLVLAGRNAEKAQSLTAQLNAEFAGDRVAGIRADAADSESLRRAFCGIDLVLVAATTVEHTERVARAAVEAGVDYLDIQFSPKRIPVLQSLADEICRAGRCFITEAGFHPGLLTAMVRFVAPHFSHLDTAIVGSVLNPEGGLPSAESVDELIEAFKDYQGQVFKDGRWQTAGSFDVRAIDFGAEFGRRSCYSMFLEEMRSLPDTYPSLNTTGFYVAGFNWFVDYLLTPVIMLSLKLWPERAVRPMGRLLVWGTQKFASPPYGVLLKIEATGEKDGKPLKVEASAFHSDGYEFTAIPVVACLLQYLDGSIKRPGLWMMGHLVDPARLFGDMERMGITVATKVVH